VAGVIHEVEPLFLPMMSVGVAKSTQADFN
jgi:hypothetical protein